MTIPTAAVATAATTSQGPICAHGQVETGWASSQLLTRMPSRVVSNVNGATPRMLPRMNGPIFTRETPRAYWTVGVV